MLTGHKQELSNIWWKPPVTSTPLKLPVNKKNTGNEVQNKLIQHNLVNVLENLQKKSNNSCTSHDKSTDSKSSANKKAKKNRLSVFVQMSSSDEDEPTETKRRPVIKLSAGKNIDIVTRNKPETKTTKPTESTHKKKKVKNVSQIESKEIVSLKNSSISTLNEVKNKQNVLICDEKAETEKGKLNLSSENLNVVSNKRTRNLNKRKQKTPEDDLKSCSKNNISVTSQSKSETNVAHSNKNNKTPEKKYETRTKKKDIHNVSEPHNTEQLKVPEVPKVSKAKKKKLTDAANVAKKSKIKSNKKTPPRKKSQTVIRNKNLIGVKNKLNHSHQLFSESTEQEYINVLDLTSNEFNESAINYSLEQNPNSKYKSFVWPYISDHKNCVKENSINERPKRKKLVPQEFWMARGSSDELVLKPGGLPNNSIKCDNHVLLNPKKEIKEEVKEKKIVTENNILQHKSNHESKQINQPLQTQNDNIAPVEELNKKVNLRSNKKGLKSNFNKDTEVNKVSVKENCTTSESKKPVHPKPVFQQLNELSFTENGSGCGVAQCWNENNFKCGVFKLESKAEFLCQTSKSKSLLGGVLVKGNLRMKIGVKEQDMKEGDMAFVPPLTPWQATNIGECESIFYYWCGKFST